MSGKQIVFKNKCKNLVSMNLSNLNTGTQSNQQRSQPRAPSTKMSKEVVDIVKIDLTRRKANKKKECNDVADELMM